MSIIWRKVPEYPDIELPQKIMRPFWHPETQQLNDQQFCVNLTVEQPTFRASLLLVISLIAISCASYFLYLYSQSYLNHKLINDEIIIGASTGILLLLISFALFYFFYRANQNRILCFKRDSHSVHYTKRGLLTHYIEQDYEKFQGKIKTYKNLFGQRRSCLLLEHGNNNLSISLFQTTDTPQSLVGYWSFIVQYMKVNAPLPDVPALHDYPNKTQGVVHQNTIDYS